MNKIKQLSQLKNEDFIAMAKLIDNNFIGNKRVIVFPMKMGIVRVVGHTDGGQCVNCDVKIDVYMNKLNGVFIHNDDPEFDGAYRGVYPPTLKKVIDYLKVNDFEYCPKHQNQQPLPSPTHKK